MNFNTALLTPYRNSKVGWLPTPTLSKTKDGRYNRITIPREDRRLLGISEGDIMERVYEDRKVIVKRGV